MGMPPVSARGDEMYETRHIRVARLLAGEGAQIGGEMADPRLDRLLHQVFSMNS
jgi:hypothetical protein